MSAGVEVDSPCRVSRMASRHNKPSLFPCVDPAIRKRGENAAKDFVRQFGEKGR